MKHFTTANDIDNADALVQEAIACKQNPSQLEFGKGKTVGLLFLNPSLRTRMSTQKAAHNLGMTTIVMNIDSDGWNLEFEDGAVMDGNTQEHIKDAALVLSQYCDVLGIRTFANLQDREEDYSEHILNKFKAHAKVPVVSLESATLHPLQSLADLQTIAESGIKQPKVAVSWAPHPKPLPQAVVNSFLQWITLTDAEVVLTHPEGYEPKEEFRDKVRTEYKQQKALEGADFVYTKSWSSYRHYGQHLDVQENWTITEEKMALTNNQNGFMHCLPVRRNVVATDGVLDQSLIYQQAENRLYSAQAVLKHLLQ